MLLFGGLTDWGYIANIVLAVMSVFTAIVTARVLRKQHRLQRKQYELDREKFEAQQLEHQPSFQFTRNEDNLTISNKGGILSGPISTAIRSMVIVKSNKLIDDEWNNYIYCHPVLYYKRHGQGTTNLNGDLAIHTFNIKDYDTLKTRIQEIQNGFMDWNKYPPIGPMTDVLSVSISDLVQINYIDMYKKAHTVYYLDAHIISKEKFDRLIEISRYVPAGIYDVNNVKVKNIIYMTYTTNHKFDL